MSNKPFTRETVAAWLLDDLRHQESIEKVRELFAERDQFAAACDIFRGKVQALEMERDALREACIIANRAEEAMRMERDEARAEGARLRGLLKNVYALLDDVDQGPRSENSNEWRLPWSRHVIKVFTEIHRALSGSPSTAEWLAQHDAKVREEAIGTVRRFLQFDSQRAVSWHEVQDCIEAIRALSTPTADKGDGAPKPKCATCGGTGRKFIGAPSEEGTQTWQPCPCGARDLVRVIAGPDCKAAP